MISRKIIKIRNIIRRTSLFLLGWRYRSYEEIVTQNKEGVKENNVYFVSQKTLESYDEIIWGKFNYPLNPNVLTSAGRSVNHTKTRLEVTFPFSYRSTCLHYYAHVTVRNEVQIPRTRQNFYFLDIFSI